MFWLLTYVGQGLDLAVGNRPVIIQVQGAQGGLETYRHGSGGFRKKSELSSSVGGNLLHLRIYPTDGSPGHMRDDLSNWLVFNDEPRITSWSPAGMLIDNMVKEPRELQNVFFALSPAVLNVLYSATSQQAPSSQSFHSALAAAATEPYLSPHDEGSNNHHQLIGGVGGGRQRAKKRRIGCRHPRGPLSVLPPILVCDQEPGRKTTAAAATAANALHESRQSNHDDLYAEQRFNTATSTKTDLARGAEAGTTSTTLNLPANGGFIPRAFAYETGKLPGSKRNQITVGRRSIDAQGESPGHQAQASSVSSAGASIASQLMLRSIRGSIQYDVPQIGK